MFIALSLNEDRLSSLYSDTAELRLLSAAGCLFCPECKQPVIFNGGEIRIHHFKHAKKSNCTNSSGESLQHLQAKKLVYDWAKVTYPSAKVELEYHIENTNQRADIYMEWENGDRFSFEIQMSSISAREWHRRHSLFTDAGTKDIWFFPNSSRRRNGVLDYINQIEHILYFINIEDNTISISGDIVNESQLWSSYEIPLDKLKIVEVPETSKIILSDDNFISKAINRISSPSPHKPNNDAQMIDKNHPFYGIHLKVLKGNRDSGIPGDYSLLEAAESEERAINEQLYKELQTIKELTIKDIDDLFNILSPNRYTNKNIYIALDKLSKLRTKLISYATPLSPMEVQDYIDIKFEYRKYLDLIEENNNSQQKP